MMTRRGFTLLEAMVVIVIISIITIVSMKTFNKSVAENELRKAAMSLYLELRGLRPLALKYDAKVFVKFYAAQCSVYVDTNDNGARESNELIKVYKLQPSTIAFGMGASGGPSAAPPGAPSGAAISWDASGIAGNWNSTVLSVDNNALGSFNSGAIYLKTSRVNRITYCIAITTDFQSLRLYKWGGTSWSTL